jgi:hypothetical protein
MAETLLLWLILIIPIAAQVPLLLYMMRHIHIEEEPPRQSQDIWGPDGLRKWDEVRPDRTASPTGDASTVGSVGGSHVCQRCGTSNGLGYRFCENCVGRL